MKLKITFTLFVVSVDCPICGMRLVPAYVETDNVSAGPCDAINCAAPGATNQP